ncbi:hypothetical protein H7H37_00020 [Mycolicibacterium insubricum]|nr:hypothetical protein [Mycolicibacterium insubricum]
MALDPRTPVLVGYGQVNQRDENPGGEPVELMEAAVRPPGCRSGGMSSWPGASTPPGTTGRRGAGWW